MPEHGGIFAGIAGGKDGAPYSAMILLDAKPDGDLNWKAALAWAEALGDGAHVPSRDESALLYANSRELMDTSDWHWTSTPYKTPYSVTDAWYQDFLYGDQFIGDQSGTCLARAVRLIQLSN
jgi:hypothetical protein